MTKTEFETTWIRESGEQPGIMLDVITLTSGAFMGIRAA